MTSQAMPLVMWLILKKTKAPRDFSHLFNILILILIMLCTDFVLLELKDLKTNSFSI